MSLTKENKLSEIVFKNLKAASVFEEYSINYSIDGKETISDACSKSRLSTETILRKLNEIIDDSCDDINFHNWSPGFLCDYIESNHHTYIRKTFPLILKKYKRLLSINILEKKGFELAMQLNYDFEIHMRKEEKLIFPYIKKLINSCNELTDFETAPFGSINNPVKVMYKEHSIANGNLTALQKNISAIQDKNSKELKKELSALLNEFIKDFHVHINFENNLLFPKAVALEKKIRNRFKKLK